MAASPAPIWAGKCRGGAGGRRQSRPPYRECPQFGVPAVVAINHFSSDTEAEVDAVREIAAAHGTEAVLCTHWADGGAGGRGPRRESRHPGRRGAGQFAPLYDNDLKLFDKINTIATRIYRADEAIANSGVGPSSTNGKRRVMGTSPVCMAKTQYSFSTDPPCWARRATMSCRSAKCAVGRRGLRGRGVRRPDDDAGAAKVPSAEGMRIDENGLIEGLS
jgi:formate--tetrahydrofolate ligase